TRDPGDELGLLRAGESVDPPQRGEITGRLFPRLDAQLRGDRSRDDGGVPGPHRFLAADAAPDRNARPSGRLADRGGLLGARLPDAREAHAVRLLVRAPR